MQAEGQRRKRKQSVWRAGLCSLLLLSGCTGLSDSLMYQANRYASGKSEEAYYFQPAAYRMKDLLASYTSGYRRTAWAEAEGEQNHAPKDWDASLTVCSDECISSGRELDEVLTKGMETAALGIELHFDRAKYLPGDSDLKQWVEDYSNTHILETLCLEQIYRQQEDTGSKRIVYLTLSYQTGREEVADLRKQLEAEAEAFAQTIEEQSGETERAESVWNYLTEQVSYPKEGWEESPMASYSRADGALLEKTAAGQGYAEAAKLLLDRLGLENEIAAEEQEQEGRYRFWNRVRIDGEWYRMDCCFGAAAGGNRDFFSKEEVKNNS